MCKGIEGAAAPKLRANQAHPTTTSYNQHMTTRRTPHTHRQAHPFANFGTGNAATLSSGDAAARRALLDFHRAHYVAPQMSLAVCHTGLEPQSRRPQAGLPPARASLAWDRS